MVSSAPRYTQAATYYWDFRCIVHRTDAVGLGDPTRAARKTVQQANHDDLLRQ